MTLCPPPDDLGRLLGGRLPPAAEAAVLAHVEHCPACQAALDRATAGAVVPPPPPPPSDGYLRLLAACPPDLQAAATLPDTTPADAQAVLAGLPGFEPVGELGRGGMGVVYKAWQKALKRFVAVKLLDGSRAAHPHAAVRFQIEAETLASLQHPNIVQVYEVGEVGGRAYFAMEYVDGGTLAGKWAGKPQAPAAAAGLVEAVARAVHYAHLRGVLHRDLKPANVLLTRPPRLTPADDRLQATDYGVPKISDFGLAKRLTVDATLTASGAVLGTPEYMAPEQATEGAADHGPGCDVYALGVLLYEGLTGRPPFKGRDLFDLLDQVRSRAPVPPRRLAPRVPADLETVCLKCLAKEPARRYPSAAELADDLGRVRRGEPVHARRAGSAERAWKWVRRNPAGAALVGMSVVAVLAVGGFLGGMAYNSRLNLALAAADDARYRHLIVLAAADAAARDPRQALRQLDDCPPDRRGWEWHYLRRLCQPHLLELAAPPARPLAVGYAPAGGRVLAVGPDGRVRSWEADGRPLAAATVWDGPLTAAAFDPGRGRVVVGDATGRVGVRLAVGGGGWTTDRPLPVVTAAAFGPDGQTVATAHADGVARVWDTVTGAPAGEFPVPLVRGLTYSPDGRQVAAAGSRNTVYRWDVAARTALPRLVGRDAAGKPADDFTATAVAYSPDGRLVAATCPDQAVRVWDAATGEQVRLLEMSDEPACLAFSPDGSRLAVGGFDRTVRVWEAADWDGPAAVVAVDGPIVGVGFAPDGRRLVTTGPDGTIKVWRAIPLTSADVRPATGGPANTVTHAPAGKLVVGDGKGRVSLLDAAGEGPAVELGRRPSAVWAVAVRPPDGRQAAAIWRDGTLGVWELPAGVAAGPPTTAHAEKGANGLQSGRAVGYSPDGRLLATGGLDGAVKVWDADTRELLATLPADPDGVECLRFSPAGGLLAVGGRSGRATLWDTGDWTLIRTLPPHGGTIRCLAFGPGGRTLAVGGQDPAIRVWDVATGDPVATLPGYTGVVFALAYHPSGRLASAGRDGAISLWDPAAGFRLLTLTGHTNEVYGLEFDPTGRRLASASRDGTVRVWDGGEDR